MAYRLQHPEARCEKCDRPARAVCKRCDALFCRRHKPAGGTRCQKCEDDFVSKTALLVGDKPPTALRMASRVKMVFGSWLAVGASIGLIILSHLMRSQFTGLAVGLMIVLTVAALLVSAAGGALLLFDALLEANHRADRLRFQLARRAFLRERPKKELLDAAVRKQLAAKSDESAQ